MLALGVKELPALIDCRCDNRIVVLGKWNVGAVGFEEVLVDMKAGPKAFSAPSNRFTTYSCSERSRLS
jgi:hypothetical protein